MPGSAEAGQQDFGTIAGCFSQLAAVLAGFAFAGLVTVIAAKLSSGDRAKDSMNSLGLLVASYLSMVMSSVAFAIVTGEGSYSDRGTTLMMIGGPGFCASSLVLLHAILILLHGVKRDVRSARLSAPVSLVRNTLVLAVVPLMLLANLGPAAAVESSRYGANGDNHDLSYFIVVVTVISTIVGAGLLVMYRRRRDVRPSVRLLQVLSASAIALAATGLAAMCTVPLLFSPSAPGEPTVGVVTVATLSALAIGVCSSAAQCR